MYPHVAEDEKSTFIDNSVDICLLDVDNTDPRSPAVCNGQSLLPTQRETLNSTIVGDTRSTNLCEKLARKI